MREVDQEDEAEEEEEHGAEEGDIVAPDHEEAVGDEEGEDDEAEPEDDLWSPEAVLDACTRVFGGSYAEEGKREEEVEHAKGEVDAVDGDPAVACSLWTAYFHVIECEVLEFVDSPWCEHDPCEYRIDHEKQSVCYARGDAAQRVRNALS